MEEQTGKFIVIDGTDGSGKATQTRILVERLKQIGYEVEIADFPQYGKKSAGLVEEYLNGKFGSAEEVGPYRASVFYAVDRYAASEQLKKWLKLGKIVISNRYVSANMAHQGGKISDPLARKAFFDWLINLEYDLFNIPSPDLNIILHVEAAVAQRLVDQKERREYLNGQKRDIHEADLSHLKQAEQVYLEITNSFPKFKIIECTNDDQIMSINEIHELVWLKVMKLLNPPLEKVLASNFLQDVNNNCVTTKEAVNPPAGEEYRKPACRQGRSQIVIQRLSPAAKLPTRACATNAGLDLFSADYYSILPNEQIIIQTGIKMALPDGYTGLIWDKGGIARNGLHTMAGVIDSGFCEEITVQLINLSGDIYNIAPGQKIAQLLIQKIENLDIVEGNVKPHITQNS